MASSHLLVRQCADSFIRVFDDVGYITNQRTQQDRAFDEVGAVFLQQISRQPKEVAVIARELSAIFPDADPEALSADLLEFIADLEADAFLVTGRSTAELDRKDRRFSYATPNPKTATIDFRPRRLDSVLANTEDYFREKFGARPRIFGMQIEGTSHCNERCIHCYLPPDRVRKHIETALLLDVMDQAREMGTIGMIFSGGEFILHPDVESILLHARRSDFMVSVLTNGALLSDDLIALLKNVNCNLVQVSLYSMNPTIHDAITQVRGSFTSTMQGLERLVAADIPVQISCPIMKENQRGYAEVLRWAQAHKVKTQTDLVLMARSDCDRGNLVHRAAPEETTQVIEEMLELDEGYQALLALEPKSADAEAYARQPVCGAGIDSLCMDASGNFYPCAGWQGDVVGNAYRQRLQEVWEESEGLRVLRHTTNASLPVCLHCEARDYCAVCLAKNYNESGGDMFSVNPHYCEVAFLNKHLVEKRRDTQPNF